MRITKWDNIIALILFVVVMSLPAYIKVASWQIMAMLSFASLTILGCWRLSYLSWRKKNDKAIS